MAQAVILKIKKRAQPRRRAEDRKREALHSELLGVAILVLSLCLMLALISFHPEDLNPQGSARLTGRAQNLIGPVGASLADIILSFLGIVGFILPLSLSIPGVFFLTGRSMRLELVDLIGYPLTLLLSAIAAQLWFPNSLLLGHEPGGWLGAHGAAILQALFGLMGAYLLVYSALILTFIFSSRVSLIGLFRVLLASLRRSPAALRRQLNRPGEALRRWRLARAERATLLKLEREEETISWKLPWWKRLFGGTSSLEISESARESGRFSLGDLSVVGARHTQLQPPTSTQPEGQRTALSQELEPLEPNDTELQEQLLEEGDTLLVPSLLQTQHSFGSAQIASESREAELETPKTVAESKRAAFRPIQPEPAPTQLSLAVLEVEDREQPQIKRAEEQPLDLEQGDHSLPSPLLLFPELQAQINVEPLLLQDLAKRLIEALKEFKIDGQVMQIHPGPVITMFEFEPAPGVRISKITKLADDLAMALKAVKLRIVAPIPGKGVIGFEVPNAQREMVHLGEVIATRGFKKGRTLPLALGKDIHGEAVFADLAKMPHLLVAGTTGSGKSVGIHSMILSLLYCLGPEDLRFIMMDPKMLELNIYEGIPHLLQPVVTDPREAAETLRWVVEEMERRYLLMKEARVRDLQSYNQKLEQLQLERARSRSKAEEGSSEKLPYLVLIIDEFADLMIVAGKKVEGSVARIAQKARAAGIHLILATQRPSVDVITGVIKANFPTRIAFKVSSAIDSRTILTTHGAEKLLGQGDMLYMPPGTSALKRIHGAFVSDPELQRVVEHLRAQGEAKNSKT